MENVKDTLARVKLHPIHDDEVCGEHGAIPTATHCPACGGYVPFDHTTQYDHMGAVTVGTGCIVEVASDRSAMVEALAEYGFRLFFEHGARWRDHILRLEVEAQDMVLDKIQDELKSKQGAICR